MPVNGNMKKAILFLLVLSGIVAAGCKKETVDKIECDNTGFTTSTVKYSTTVVSILQPNCYSCHSNATQLGGVNLEGFANAKIYADNGKLLNTIAHTSGFSAMPQNASKLPQDQICKIKFWIENGTLNN